MSEQEKDSPPNLTAKITRRNLLFKVLPLAALAVGVSQLSKLAPRSKIELEIPSRNLNSNIAPNIIRAKNSRLTLPQTINGINLPSWKAGEYQLPQTLQSLQQISEINPNMISIVPTQYQKTAESTEIGPTNETATDSDIEHMIDKVHELGYPVMLAPHINLSNDPTHWHGEIGANFTDSQWNSWFNSYRAMIENYAQIAEDHGVELFVVGNEYYYASLDRPVDWITTISGIRAKYSGPLTYAAHFYEFDGIDWWSELDLLGLNPYYKLTDNPLPKLEELKSAWGSIINGIEPTVQRWNKPLIFPEIGYPSVEKANIEPWNYKLISDPNVPLNFDEQRNCVLALYETVWPLPWWHGVVWWHWDTDPNSGGLNDRGYTPKRKPAASVIKAFGNAIPK